MTRLLPYRGTEVAPAPWEVALFDATTLDEVAAAIALKHTAMSASAQQIEFLYDESEPRDAHGRWTKGADWEAGADGRDTLYMALRDGTNPDGKFPAAENIGDVTDEQRGAAKAAIVKAAGQDIANAVRTDPAVAAEMNWAYPQSGFRDSRWALLLDRQEGNWTDADIAAKDNATLYGEIKAQEYVDSWAGSAADNDPISLALQRTTENVLDAHSDSFDHYLEGTENQERMQGGEDATMEAFVRGEYDRTQAYLKDLGVSEVTLYRGMKFPEGGLEAPSAFTDDDAPHRAAIDMNPASSWSVDRQVADEFTQGTDVGLGFTLSMTVPAKDIISTAATGRGALTEGEVLVRNQPGATALVEPRDM